MDLLTPDFGLLFWMVLSFSILALILGKFGWPVIVSMIEERGNYIEESLKKADEANAALANIKAEGEKLLAETKNERLEMLKEASEQTNISKSIICKVCNGKGHTAGGFIWRYEDNPLESDECIKTKKRAILQYDKHGNFIKEYDSITEAAKQTNTNQGNI